MNNKGFTTIELVLTLALAMVVMISITGVTHTYQDETEKEEIKTEMLNYKNKVTKIIYDDILGIKNSNGKVVKIELTENGYKFITGTDYEYNLEVINENEKVGIKYNNIEYIIPMSNNNLVEFIKVITYPNDLSESDIYSLDIYFNNKKINEELKLHFIVSK